MLIIGHRGAMAEAPENTLAGFAHLRRLGIHRVELDLHLSASGELVVNHDDTADRTTFHSGPIRGLTANDLAALDARKTFRHWPHKVGVPTLRDVLTEWPYLKSVQLEVKATADDQIETMIEALESCITECDLQNRAVITCEDANFLKASKARLPQISHGWVVDENYPDIVEQCLKLNCNHLISNSKLLKPEVVADAHNHKLHVSAWTVNDKKEALRLHQMGVDSIITDCPSEFNRLPFIAAPNT